MLSPAVQSASVLGGGAPVIAVQPAILERLDMDDVDRVVIHEWAHVQRCDDLVNVPHLAVRVLAGWHPAIWWLERQLRIEREIACDELAVALTGSSKRYAACLTTIARLFPRELQPLGTVGASSSALTTRVVRILSQRHLMSWRWSAVAGSVAVLTIGTLSVVFAGYRLVESVAPQSRVDRTLVVTTPAVVSSGPAVLGKTPTSPFESLAAKTRVPKWPRAKSAPGLATRGRTITAEKRLTPSLPLVASSADEGREEPVPVAHFSPRPDSAPILASRPALTAPVPAAADLSKPSTLRTGSPWGAVADAGVAAARGSQKAGIATATFFTRFGKKLAGAF